MVGANGKDKVKHVGKAGKKGGQGKPVDLFAKIDRETVNEMVDYEEMDEKMRESVQHFQKRLTDITQLRTSLATYDNLSVETPDGKFKLMELAQIAQKTPQMIAINLESASQYLKHVETALYESGLNVNPQRDGNSLFIVTQAVTTEHRKEIIKKAHALATQHKDTLRKYFSKYNNQVKNAKSVSKDDKQEASHVLKGTMDVYAAQMHSMLEKAEQDLLGSRS